MAKKRKMPAHIVLPNGMWRFVKSGTKKAVRAVNLKELNAKEFHEEWFAWLEEREFLTKEE